MIGSLLWLALSIAPASGRAGDPVELRKALDALRAGAPGEPAFDEALPQLPELIASGSGWFVASGAYLSGRHSRAECIPALVEALGRENAAPPDHADFTKVAILDALILLEAEVPATLVTQRLEANTLAPSFLLLARQGESAADGLLALFDAAPANDEARWAAACALVAARHPRIAQRLLAGMEWELDLVVRDPGSGAAVGQTGGIACWTSAHAQWPPRVIYDLRLPADGEPLMPVGFERRERTRSGRLPARLYAPERTAWRARLIDDLLGESEERGLLRRSEDMSIEWTDADAYAGAVRAHCLDFHDRIARVAARLESAGFLERGQDVAASATIRIRIHDLRDSPATPLPPAPELPRVTYSRE